VKKKRKRKMNKHKLRKLRKRLRRQTWELFPLRLDTLSLSCVQWFDLSLGWSVEQDREELRVYDRGPFDE
jgi:hypothetical protein